MPIVSFDSVRLHQSYSRHDLAGLWGYNGIQGLSRGVVTPGGQPLIILFVTREKQDSYEQYENRLVGTALHWEGPVDHFAEDRMLNASELGDEIHVFYRDKHHTDFEYLGRARVRDQQLAAESPSRFVFALIDL